MTSSVCRLVVERGGDAGLGTKQPVRRGSLAVVMRREAGRSRSCGVHADPEEGKGALWSAGATGLEERCWGAPRGLTQGLCTGMTPSTVWELRQDHKSPKKTHCYTYPITYLTASLRYNRQSIHSKCTMKWGLRIFTDKCNYPPLSILGYFHHLKAFHI